MTGDAGRQDNSAGDVVRAQAPAGAETAAAFVAWLLAEGQKAADIGGLLHLFAERARAMGLPLDRMTIHIGVLHPQIRGVTYIWRRDEPVVETIYREHGIELTPGFRDSPIATIREERADGVRVPIARLRPPYPFPVIDDLVAEGFTDYAAMPMHFSNAQRNVATFATRIAPGWGSGDLALIHDVLPALTVLLEVRAQRLVTANLLDVYVGPEAGQRILKGDIRRGTGLSIRAVLWFCDLRGFTGLADRLPMDQLIALLNNYFEIMGGAVTRRGGEVLKFIGDAMLAIFPIATDGDRSDLTAKASLAFEAAMEAMEGMARLNAQRAAWGQPKLGSGIALHVGDVMYGNIGAPARLDFTVIGPAVNLVTRLEGITRRFDRRLLTSSHFAEALGGGPLAGQLMTLGSHPVRGLREPVEVFGLTREGSTILSVTEP